MQANLSLIRGDTLPLSIDSIAIQGTEEKYILSDTDIIYMDTQSFEGGKNIVKKKNEIFIAAGTLLSSWLGILYVPVLILVCCNVIDYATGLVAAK